MVDQLVFSLLAAHFLRIHSPRRVRELSNYVISFYLRGNCLTVAGMLDKQLFIGECVINLSLLARWLSLSKVKNESKARQVRSCTRGHTPGSNHKFHIKIAIRVLELSLHDSPSLPQPVWPLSFKWNKSQKAQPFTELLCRLTPFVSVSMSRLLSLGLVSLSTAYYQDPTNFQKRQWFQLCLTAKL